MKTVRTAVIGVGSMGRWHAQKFAALPESQLIAVVDAGLHRAQAVADECGAPSALQDYGELIGNVDAVALATPTSTHFDIARTLLENDIHVLMEKPIAASMDEARVLVELAESKGLVLQVGHLERFNPAIVAITDRVNDPLFVESTRIAPYKPRSLDVSVVLDLMIHDIDLVHSLTGAAITEIDAVGRQIFSDSIDIANARIRFENGCVANITSSRISMKTERALRIFQSDSYLSIDLHNKAVSSYSKKGDGPVTGPEGVAMESQAFGESDALLEQARAFLASVAGGPPPLVSGRTGMAALETATIVGELVNKDKQ